MSNQTDAGKYINKIYNRLRRNFGKDMGQFGLTTAQCNILSYILLESETDKLHQKDIEKEFALRSSTATELLQALEKKELIMRINDEQDGRYKVLYATQKAEKIRESLQVAIRQKEEILTKGISGQELKCFKTIAGKMLCNLEQWEEEM